MKSNKFFLNKNTCICFLIIIIFVDYFRERNEIIRYDEINNKKTIYRFITPEHLGLSQEFAENVTREPIVSLLSTTAYASDVKPTIKKRGRPAKQVRNSPKTTKKINAIANTNKPPKVASADIKSQETIRTRYGRLVKNINGIFSSNSLNRDKITQQNPDEPENAAQFLREFLQDLKESEYKYNNKSSSSPNSLKHKSPPHKVLSANPSKRRNSRESVCETCKKVFFGKQLLVHYKAHPDHNRTSSPPNPNPPQLPSLETTSSEDTELSLFKFLVRKLQNSLLTEDQRVDIFLNEINDLVDQLQSRSSRLVRNTSGLNLVSPKTAKVLGIPEGQYSLDLSALEAPPDPPCILQFDNILPPPTNTRSLDYNLSMSLDNTLIDAKLSLAGVNLLPPSEESLLRAVNDLMKEGMNKIGKEHADLLHLKHLNTDHNQSTKLSNRNSLTMSSTPSIHYDHASDNAVEAVSMKETAQPPLLDLSIDLFQFSSN